MSVDAKGKLYNVSVTAPGQWLSFEQAVELAEANVDTVTTWVNPQGVTITQTGFTVGYILNAADPFTCIDLDVKDASTHPDEPDKWTSADDFQRYMSIVQTMDSYTERSKSGKGLHIWVRGNIGKGFRRDGVEIYSQERFIISTGDAYITKGIENREPLLLNMVHQMRPLAKVIELEELPEEADDWYILHVAAFAANGDKFLKLFKGLWREDEFGYPSQSEADLSLMSMFTFYSPSNAQCRRLFRESGLGKREKSVKDDKYLNFTLKTIRDRQAREAHIEMSALLQAAENVRQIAQEEIARLQGGVPAATALETPFGTLPPRTVVPLQVPGTGEPVADRKSVV